MLATQTFSDFLREYLLVGLFGILACGVVAGFIGLSSVFRPSRPTAGKVENYESGVDPVGGSWAQSQIRYYIFALMFVMFDVEAVFIFPWAVRLEAFGFFGLVEMVIFMFILALGLGYAWRKGVLRWV